MRTGKIEYTRQGKTRTEEFDPNDPQSILKAMQQFVGMTILIHHISVPVSEETLRGEWKEAVASGETELGFSDWKDCQ